MYKLTRKSGLAFGRDLETLMAVRHPQWAQMQFNSVINTRMPEKCWKTFIDLSWGDVSLSARNISPVYIIECIKFLQVHFIGETESEREELDGTWKMFPRMNLQLSFFFVKETLSETDPIEGNARQELSSSIGGSPRCCCVTRCQNSIQGFHLYLEWALRDKYRIKRSLLR